MITKPKPGRPRQWPPTKERNGPVNPATEFEALDDTDTTTNGHHEAPAAFPAPSADFMDKLHLDSRVTTLRLVAMARQFGVRLEERWIGQTLAHVGLSSERGRGFELLPALFALIGFFQNRADKTNKVDTDRDRKKKAEADTAELKAMELAGEVIPLEAAKLFWSDARIELRKVVELAGYLTTEQRVKLLQDFQGLKTKLENGENE